jgi:enolase
MIAFRKGWEPNNNKNLILKLQKLLDLALDESDEQNYDGAVHESKNIGDLIQIVYDSLYTENNNCISLIINKNSNNSLDITIDKVE